jgi:hypothetical protein
MAGANHAPPASGTGSLVARQAGILVRRAANVAVVGNTAGLAGIGIRSL